MTIASTGFDLLAQIIWPEPTVLTALSFDQLEGKYVSTVKPHQWNQFCLFAILCKVIIAILAKAFTYHSLLLRLSEIVKNVSKITSLYNFLICYTLFTPR